MSNLAITKPGNELFALDFLESFDWWRPGLLKTHGSAVMIEASNDMEAISTWLNEYKDNRNTFESYRKEVERLILWAAVTHGKVLSDLTREDYQKFEEFLLKPEPQEHWCGRKAPRGTPDWRPLHGPLRPSSIRQSLTIINSLLNYLLDVGYLTGNPLSARRRKLRANEDKNKKVERYLDERRWLSVMSFLDTWPRITRSEIEAYERARWILSFLYLMGARTSEFITHQHNSLYVERRPSGDQWWWKVHGKGSKDSTIPVPASLVPAMVRYRLHLGLPPYPSHDDQTPLVVTTDKNRNGISRSMLYKIIKKIFLNAANWIEADDPHGAEILREASTHWIRHTFVTHQGNVGVSLKYRQRSARHARIDTTLMYDHADNDAWYESVQVHQLHWPEEQTN